MKGESALDVWKPLLDALLAFLIYFGAGLFAMALFLWLYTKVTPYHEWELVHRNNPAAALSLSGTMIGFAVVVATLIVYATHPIGFLLWSLVAGIVQILAFLVTSLLIRDLAGRIERGEVAAGGILGAISLTIGIINAAAMVD